MNRLIALLFIPFIAVGNGLPHTHGGESARDDHSSRPHVHVGLALPGPWAHHHHDDDCEEHNESADDIPVDHDSDAVYLSGDQFYLRPSETVQSNNGLECIEYFRPQYTLAADKLGPLIIGHEVAFQDGLPLFLLHAALRC